MLIKCRWSKTDGGARVACGGGDRTVTVWEVETGKILYKLGGHKGSVGAVDWHPREPISELDSGCPLKRWMADRERPSRVFVSLDGRKGWTDVAGRDRCRGSFLSKSIQGSKNLGRSSKSDLIQKKEAAQAVKREGAEIRRVCDRNHAIGLGTFFIWLVNTHVIYRITFRWWRDFGRFTGRRVDQSVVNDDLKSI